MSEQYLFPRRQTRRDFLKAAGLALSVPILTRADDPSTKVVIGEGAFRYELDPNWGRLPAGMNYGYGCAVIVDGQDRVFVTSRSTNPCVAIFDREGQLLETWSNDFGEKIGYSVEQYKDTAHGLYWSREGDQEFLYWTENASTNKEGPKFGRRVYKTDLKGKVLYTLGPGVQEGPNSQPFDFTNPTDVAVAPNGDIYVVDGYGSQKVHRFDKNFKWLKTIGGPGKDHGQFNVCHGVWVSTLGQEPEVYIADRHNDRIEVFSVDLQYKRTVTDVRTPCCFYQHQGHLFVPELGQRVTVLDSQDRVAARLGDGKGFEKEIAKHPNKFAFPHALTLDSRGDLYVIEWLPDARPRKFRRVKA